MQKHLTSFALLLLCSGCACTHSDGSKTALNDSIPSEVKPIIFAPTETVTKAKEAGYDYEKIVRDCVAKNKSSLRTLFELTAQANFDGASSEGHADVLEQIIKNSGDSFFAEELALMPQKIQNKVGTQMAYTLNPEVNPVASRKFKQKYPQTYAASFTLRERVRHCVLACRREIHGWQPDCDVAKFGINAIPILLAMTNDNRKVWVRIRPPQGGPESRFIDVNYLYADNDGPRNSVAEFALLCIYRIIEPKIGTTETYQNIWQPILKEFSDYDGLVTSKTINEIKRWYQAKKNEESIEHHAD